MKELLIIEDDEIVGSIYRNKLTTEGFNVELVRDGEAGLQSIERHPPDLVLLDLMIPKLNGVEVLRAMRARPELKNIPVIIFSNTYLTNMVQEAWRAGASRCLSKASSSPKQVIEAVREVLSRATRVPKPETAPGGPPAAVRPGVRASRRS